MSANYGYLNARVRGLRAKLLDEGFALGAIESGSFDAFVTSLSQTTYGPDLEEARARLDGLTMVDAAIAANLSRTTRSLLAMADGDAHTLLSMLLLRFDAANLKSIARLFHARAGATGEGDGDAGATLSAAILPAGQLDAATLERMALAADLPNAAQVLLLRGHSLARAFRRAVAAYAANGDLLELELAIDLGYHATARELVAQVDVPEAFERFVRLDADATNLRTALKLRGRSLENARFFVDGGRVISRDVFLAIAAAPIGAALPTLRPPFDVVGENADLTGVETAVRGVVERLSRSLTHDPLDIGLATHYLFAKEREAALLRLVARGTYYGVPGDTLRRELGHA